MRSTTTNPRPRFVAVGHVTNDLLDGGALVAGGSALYASLAAARLGADARIVTSHGDDFVGRELLRDAGVAVETRPAARTTCFENVYDNGRRRQRVHAVADRIHSRVDLEADVVFLCPVIDEITPRNRAAPPGGLLAAGLQGWLRALAPDGNVRRRSVAPETFRGCDYLFCSIDDLTGEDEIPRLRSVAPNLIVTEAERGARLYLSGEARPWRVLAHPADEVDPTGAGDVFAAAFLVALARGSSPLDAAVYAACAASIAVEGMGTDGLEALAAVDNRVKNYRREIEYPLMER